MTLLIKLFAFSIVQIAMSTPGLQTLSPTLNRVLERCLTLGMKCNDLEVDVLADLREILLLLSDNADERQHIHRSSFVAKDLPKHEDL